MLQHVLLSVGRDPRLMLARTQLLDYAGYLVLPSFTNLEALKFFISRDIDLVILCHTIPQKAKRKLIVSMREKTQRIPIISIHTGGEADGKLVDAYAYDLDGPEALLSCIAKILDKSVGGQIAS